MNVANPRLSHDVLLSSPGHSDSSSCRSTMSGSKYSSAAIREAWQKVGKQRWDGQTHGRGLCLLIVEILQGSLIPGRPRSLNRSFEFWRDQRKIRGRFIGDSTGCGVVVANLDEDGFPVLADIRASGVG